MKNIKVYSAEELRNYLLRESERVQEGNYLIYEMLKEFVGIKERWLPQEVYRKNIENICEVLEL